MLKSKQEKTKLKCKIFKDNKWFVLIASVSLIREAFSRHFNGNDHLAKLCGKREALSLDLLFQESSASICRDPKVISSQHDSRSKEEHLLSDVTCLGLH